MSKTEKILLGLTLAFFVGFCLLLPRPERHIRTAEESYARPGPTPAAAPAADPGTDGLWIVLETRVDVNTAAAAELATLPGVGEVLSGRIVAYREEHGPFDAPEDLLAVEGVGNGLLCRLFPDFARANGG